MRRILVPNHGASAWRQLLADRDTQWRRAASAMELAVSWECAQRTQRGLPPEVAAALDQAPELAGCHLLFALPEHQVALDGRGKASQNDVWALLRTRDHSISMAVEGKAGEPFGSTIGEWLERSSNGKKERLSSLCDILHVTTPPPPDSRYQLFHRTVSAILEARRCGATFAVMLVQSFRDDRQAWQDFEAFCSLLRATAVRGGLAEAPRPGLERLFLAWVDARLASDSEIASVV